MGLTHYKVDGFGNAGGRVFLGYIQGRTCSVYTWSDHEEGHLVQDGTAGWLEGGLSSPGRR